MQTIQLKTWSASHKNQPYQFFILSKGKNAGKPLTNPCPNCFVVTARHHEQKELLYWLTYALWQSGSYRQHLVGSVIEFLHIDDVCKLLGDCYTNSDKCQHNYQNYVSMLNRLAHYEAKLKEQLVKTDQLKRSLAKAFVKTPR